MDAATVVLLAIVGIIVGAIALHLIAIAASLRKITGTLTKVKGGVGAIKGQTDPITDVVGGLAADVAAIDDDLEGLLVVVGEAQARADAEGAVAPVPAAVGAVLLEEPNGAEPHQPRRPTMREAVARARARSRV